MLAREKAISAAWKALESEQAIAFDLRKQFIEKLTVTSKNRAEILMGAIHAAALESVEYNSPDRDGLYKLLNIEENVYGDKRAEQLGAGLAALQNGDLAKVVYAHFGDDAKTSCTTVTYKTDFPEYKAKLKLVLIYNWLASLGYEMSTEESALLCGQHEAYKAGENFKAGTAK